MGYLAVPKNIRWLVNERFIVKKKAYVGLGNTNRPRLEVGAEILAREEPLPERNGDGRLAGEVGYFEGLGWKELYSTK